MMAFENAKKGLFLDYEGNIKLSKARLDEAQAGIKNAGRNINNLRNADDPILTTETKEEIKSFLMIMKEESEKAGLKHNIQKN